MLGLIAIGNPLLFWGSIAAFVWLAWLAVRRRDPNLATAPALVAVLYLPWLATSRQSYIYYLTPAIPFLAILVAAALARLAGPRPPDRRWAALCMVVGAATVGAAAGGTLVAAPRSPSPPWRRLPAWSWRATRAARRRGREPGAGAGAIAAWTVRRRRRRAGPGLAAVRGVAARPRSPTTPASPGSRRGAEQRNAGARRPTRAASRAERPQRGARRAVRLRSSQPISAAMTAFWACRRFSAWSKTTDCGL